MARTVLRDRWDFSIHSTTNMLNVLDTVVIVLDAHSLKSLLSSHHMPGDTQENRIDENTCFCGGRQLINKKAKCILELWGKNQQVLCV